MQARGAPTTTMSALSGRSVLSLTPRLARRVQRLLLANPHKPPVTHLALSRAHRRCAPARAVSHNNAEQTPDDPSSVAVAGPSSRSAAAASAAPTATTTRLLSLALGTAGLFGSGFSTDGPLSVLQALGVLASIIAFHEAGHFAAARLQGIRVTQFAVGFGPPLFACKDASGIEYSLRAVPLGGYVAFPDDDPDSGIPANDPDLLKNRPLAQRAAVICAGVAANAVFAAAVLLVQISTVGRAQSAYLEGVRVPQVNAGGAAEAAGLRPGDVILRVGDYTIPAASSQVPDLVSRIKASPSRRLDLLVRRVPTPTAAGTTASTQQQQLVEPVAVTPVTNRDGSGSIGVSLLANTFIEHTKPHGALETVVMAASEWGRLASTVARGLTQLFTNFGASAGQLSGPIAIVAQGSEIARSDSAGLFQFAAIVNLNLAAVNLLPLPALDGGYLALVLIEAARGGRKLPQALERGVALSGLLVLTALGVGLMVKDTLSLL